MSAGRHSWAVLLVTFASAGCGEEGVARVATPAHIRQSGAGRSVARIAPEGIGSTGFDSTPAIARVVADVSGRRGELAYTPTSRTFAGSLADVAAGMQVVTATAFDATGALAGTGSATVNIPGGGSTSVVVDVYETSAAPRVPDHGPLIVQLDVPSQSVQVGASQTVSATAVDADGDAIGFEWTTSPGGCGSLSGGGVAAGTATIGWTATFAGWCTVTATASANGKADSRSVAIQVSPRAPWPVSVSTNGRYLVDGGGAPWRIQADAGWFLSSGATEAQVATYLDDRASRGFNAFYLMAVVKPGAFSAIAPNAPANSSGVLPFAGSLADQSANAFRLMNEPYWAWLDGIVDAAAARDMVVMLFPNYVGMGDGSDGWYPEFTALTVDEARAWGVWLGSRYRWTPNLVWMAAGDKRPSLDQSDGINTVAVIDGIRSTGDTHLWGAEFSNPDDLPCVEEPLICAAADVDGIRFTNSLYGYGPGQVYDTFATADEGYRASPTRPAWMQESPYEGEDNMGTGIGDLVWVARRARFWSVLAGATAGDGMGSSDVYRLRWLSDPSLLATPGSVQAKHAFDLFATIPWWDMRPSGTGTDFAGRALVTGGGGTCTPGSTDCVTASVSADGRHLLTYYPGTSEGSSAATFSVDLTAMAGTTRARWFNPVNGEYTSIGTFANTGVQAFTTPGDNGAGNDWLLVLDVW